MRRLLFLVLMALLAACGTDEIRSGSPPVPETSDRASAATSSPPTTEPSAPDSSTPEPRADPTGIDSALPDHDGQPLEPNATIERVVDGDTVVVEVAGQTERVRLIGIDTPESVAENRPEQCFGTESADYLAALIPPGTPVTLIRDVEARDRFDRLLAYVVRSSDGLFVNLDLVANGYAGPFTYPPNDYYADVLERAAADAADAGLGLWGVCGGPDVPLT